MHAIRSLVALLLIAPIAFAQKVETKPGAELVLRVITTNDEGFAALTLAHPEFAEKGVPSKVAVFLKSQQVETLFDTLKANRSTTVLQAPRLTVFSEQTGQITTGEWRTFTTALEPKTEKDSTIYVPKIEKMHHGITASFQPTVSADKSIIKLKTNISLQSINSIVPLYPVTFFVTPVFEGGSQGQPVPFTQFVQQPVVQKLSTETTVAIPKQSCMALYLGKQNVELQEPSVPMMSKIPYLNRLFKNTTSESRHVICLITASAVDLPAEEDYVKSYRKAVAEGRLDEAKKLAEKALAADPACFAK